MGISTLPPKTDSPLIIYSYTPLPFPVSFKRFKPVVWVDPWFAKYIFPNSMIPSMKQSSESVEKLFIIEDLHNFGIYYDPTLMSWFNNFDLNWDALHKFHDDRFCRMWKYYLLSSAGTFRARCLQVWQIVFSKNGIPGGYTPVR
jgi:cyclopropane-fatty-acyl-phospholipid synthase